MGSEITSGREPVNIPEITMVLLLNGLAPILPGGITNRSDKSSRTSGVRNIVKNPLTQRTRFADTGKLEPLTQDPNRVTNTYKTNNPTVTDKNNASCLCSMYVTNIAVRRMINCRR